MEASLTLKNAIKKYSEGDSESFNIIYNESQRYVYTCIYKVAKGNNNAEDMTADVMSDTYLEISQSIGQLEDSDRFLQWAGTIATRKCYTYIKKNERYVLQNEDEDMFGQLQDDENLIPEAVIQNREAQKLLRDIIDKELTDMQKLCIIGVYYNDKKQSELAKELGIPENTVKTHLSRAKAKLKTAIEQLNIKSGTKVLSFAALFLLLFDEEAKAAVIPAETTAKVLKAVNNAQAAATGSASGSAVAGSGSVSGATVAESASMSGAVAVGSSAGMTTAATAGPAKSGSIASFLAASVRNKIIAAVVSIAVIGAVGGGIYGAVSKIASKDPVEIETEIKDQDFEEKANTPVNSATNADTEAPSNSVSDTSASGDDVSVEDQEEIIEQEVPSQTFSYALDADSLMEILEGTDDISSADTISKVLGKKCDLLAESCDDDELYRFIHDFDHDGQPEAFLILGQASPEGSHMVSEILFLNSHAEETEVPTRDDKNNQLYGYVLGDKIAETETQDFLIWEKDAFGSSSTSYVFSVKNGESYEPEISRTYMNFMVNSEGEWYGYSSDFSEGYHAYIENHFELDSEAGEFTLLTSEKMDF